MLHTQIVSQERDKREWMKKEMSMRTSLRAPSRNETMALSISRRLCRNAMRAKNRYQVHSLRQDSTSQLEENLSRQDQE
jgi:hypothetical protein